MFMGEYDHQLDTKGRMIIPSKFRYDLNERFIITRGLDKCLFGYTLDEWQQIEEKMKTLPMTKKDARKFMRMFFSGAIEVELDKQGRINIPQNLRKYANLTKECTVIGCQIESRFGTVKHGMISMKNQKIVSRILLKI